MAGCDEQQHRGWLRRCTAALMLLILAACAARQPSPPPPAPAPPVSVVLPWTASIGALQNVVRAQTCTATLVARDVIVTAAHCLANGAPELAGRDFVFRPNEGASPSLLPLRVLGIQAVGQNVKQGEIDGSQAAGDWALLRIEPAPDKLQPVAVNNLSYEQIQARLIAGDHFFSGGYGTPGRLAFRQHDNCAIVDGSKVHQFLDDGLIASSCNVRLRDSGGPMIMVDILGRPHLIAIISGIGQPNSDHPFGIGVEARVFLPYLKAVPVGSLVPLTLPVPAG